MNRCYRPFSVLSGLGILLVLVAGYALTIGPIDISFLDVTVTFLGAPESVQTALVVSEIRLPRILLGMLVGAGLGVAGAAMQGLFRNPLADPALVGVSSGAALAAVTVIVLGHSLLEDWVGILQSAAIPVATFLGGLLVTWIIYRVATRNDHTDVGLMLLAGVAVNAIAASATGFLTYLATDEALRNLTFWTMGSISGATWSDLMMVFLPILVALIGMPFFARGLNAFSMGEAVSSHMGFQVKRLKWGVIGLSALAVGAAVSVSGIIGFVGLVAPHLVRLLLGPDHRWLLPGSALIGGVLVVMSDLLARTLLAPAEIPIGIVMSAIGGPFFLWLLLQRRSRVGL